MCSHAHYSLTIYMFVLSGNTDSFEPVGFDLVSDITILFNHFSCQNIDDNEPEAKYHHVPQ